MTAIYVICFFAIAVGVVFVFGMTPDSVTNDVMRIFEKEETLREKALKAQGKKRSIKLTAKLIRVRDSLVSSGKSGQFSLACTAALVLMAAGCVTAFVIGNPFLIPVLAIAFAMIPFGFIKKTVASYNTHVKNELETALSIITTSYIRNDNIIDSVNENLQYIKPPVRKIFQSFADECGYVSPDVKKAITNLKNKVNDTVFTEWCDILLACQDDRTLKDTLMPTVTKLTDIRIVNNELKKFALKNTWNTNQNLVASFSTLASAVFALIFAFIYLPLSLLYVGTTFYFAVFVVIDQVAKKDKLGLIVDGVCAFAGLLLYAILNKYFTDGVELVLLAIAPTLVSIFSILHSFLKKSQQ